MGGGQLFNIVLSFSLLLLLPKFLWCGPEPVAQQVWDVERLIRARNPGASFTTTERISTTWQTLRSITYDPTFEEGAVGSASVEEASLVRRVRPTNRRAESSGMAIQGLPALIILTFLLQMMN